MGYRSNGLWLITGSVEEVTTALVAMHMNVPKPNGAPPDWPEFETYKDDAGNGYIKLQYSDWKWYESYPDIQWLEQCWEFLSEVTGLSGRRVRVGEDDDDIDVADFGEYPPYIYVRREIDCDEPLDGEPLVESSDKES